MCCCYFFFFRFFVCNRCYCCSCSDFVSRTVLVLFDIHVSKCTLNLFSSKAEKEKGEQPLFLRCKRIFCHSSSYLLLRFFHSQQFFVFCFFLSPYLKFYIENKKNVSRSIFDVFLVIRKQYKQSHAM